VKLAEFFTPKYIFQKRLKIMFAMHQDAPNFFEDFVTKDLATYIINMWLAHRSEKTPYRCPEQPQISDMPPKNNATLAHLANFPKAPPKLYRTTVEDASDSKSDS